MSRKFGQWKVTENGLDTVGVTGSIPVSPTTQTPRICWGRGTWRTDRAHRQAGFVPNPFPRCPLFWAWGWRPGATPYRLDRGQFAARRTVEGVTQTQPPAAITLGIDDVCAMLGGAKRSYIYHLVYQGRIKSARSGRELAFRPEWIGEFLEAEAEARAAKRAARLARHEASARAAQRAPRARRATGRTSAARTATTGEGWRQAPW